MTTIICRTGWCSQCFEAHRPQKGNYFLVYGQYRGGYYAREAMRSGISGYVPCLFMLDQVTKDGICVVSTVCCIHGCGIEYRHSKTDHKMVYGVIPDRWKTIYLPIADWNGLVMYKRDPFYMV